MLNPYDESLDDMPFTLVRDKDTNKPIYTYYRGMFVLRYRRYGVLQSSFDAVVDSLRYPSIFGYKLKVEPEE